MWVGWYPESGLSGGFPDTRGTTCGHAMVVQHHQARTLSASRSNVRGYGIQCQWTAFAEPVSPVSRGTGETDISEIRGTPTREGGRQMSNRRGPSYLLKGPLSAPLGAARSAGNAPLVASDITTPCQTNNGQREVSILYWRTTPNQRHQQPRDTGTRALQE